MMERLQSDLDRQREETNRMREELSQLQESNRREAVARRESVIALSNRIDEIGSTFKKAFEEGKRRRAIKGQLTQEKIKSMVVGELESERAIRARDHRDQTSQIQEVFLEAKKIFQDKAAKMSGKFAQTVLDVQGLQNRAASIDEDLKATSEVAALTSEYLDKGAHDYKQPDTVEYKNLVTQDNTPAKQDQAMTQHNESSPPLGMARDLR